MNTSCVKCLWNYRTSLVLPGLMQNCLLCLCMPSWRPRFRWPFQDRWQIYKPTSSPEKCIEAYCVIYMCMYRVLYIICINNSPVTRTVATYNMRLRWSWDWVIIFWQKSESRVLTCLYPIAMTIRQESNQACEAKREWRRRPILLLILTQTKLYLRGRSLPRIFDGGRLRLHSLHMLKMLSDVLNSWDHS